MAFRAAVLFSDGGRGATSPWDVSWGSAQTPFISTRGVIKCPGTSAGVTLWHTEPSLLLWPVQGSSKCFLHSLALDLSSFQIPALLGMFLWQKVLFWAKTVTGSLGWSKAVALWGWLWCWACSGCRDELFIPWVAGGDPVAGRREHGTGLCLSAFKLLPSASSFLLAVIQGFLSK